MNESFEGAFFMSGSAVIRRTRSLTNLSRLIVESNLEKCYNDLADLSRLIQ